MFHIQVDKIVKDNKTKIKIIIKIFGYLITLFSFFYIFLVLKKINFNLFSHKNDLFLFLIILVFSIFYSLLIFLLSFLWKSILEFLSNKKLPFLVSYKIYSMANVAKYLPGNIMHFVSRNLLKDRLKLNHKIISAGTVLEIIFDLFTVVIVTFFFLILNIKFFLNFINEYLSFGKLMVLSIFFLSLIISAIVIFIYKKDIIIKIYTKFFNKKFILLILKGIIINSFCFFFLGYVLLFILDYYLKLNIKTHFYVIGAYTVSWFLGFITPGAPGGLGVRESVLTFLLSNSVRLNYLLEAVFIHRLISIFGDILAYILGLSIRIKSEKTAGVV